MNDKDRFSELLDNGGSFSIFITAIKNNVNQWQAQTLKEAEESIKLFMKLNPTLTRSEAKIYKTISTEIKRIKGKKVHHINRELIKTIHLK